MKKVYKTCLILSFSLLISWDVNAQIRLSQTIGPLIGFQTDVDLDAIYPIIAVVENASSNNVQGSEITVNFAIYNPGVGGSPFLFQQQSYYNPNILAGDTLGVPVNFSLPSSVYSSYGGGGGCTIVVWPAMIGFPTLDSLEIPITIIPFSGTQEVENSSSMIYPNPVTNGYIYIVNIYNIERVELFDLYGKTIFQWNNYQATGLSLPPITPGVYWLQITTQSGETRREKIIVSP